MVKGNKVMIKYRTKPEIPYYLERKPTSNYKLEDYMTKMYIIEDDNDYKEIMKKISECETIGIDTETTGLSIIRDEIVSVSISILPKGSKNPKEIESYYLPFGHKNDRNLGNKEEKLKELSEILNERYKRKGEEIWYKNFEEIIKSNIFMYNKKFDIKMLSRYGLERYNLSVFDVSYIIWNLDTNFSFPSLKLVKNEILKWEEMKTFEELIEGEKDISYLKIDEVVVYALTDSLATLLIPFLYRKFVESSKVIYIDNRADDFFSYLEDCEHDIDVKLLLSYYEPLIKYKEELESKIYSLCGCQFNLNSASQVADVFSRLGIDTGEYGKSGKMLVSSEIITKLKIKNEIVDYYIEYKKIDHLINVQIDKFYSKLNGRDKCRFKYHLQNTPTGRTSSGYPKKDVNDGYYIRYNIQNVPNTKSKIYCIGYDERKEDTIFGYYIKEIEKPIEEYKASELVEIGEWKNSIRRCFIPKEGHIFLHVDYKSQELVILANMADDKVMKEVFRKGESPHDITSKLIFGEGYTKSERKIAKELNFSLIYGADAYSLSKSLSITKEEASEFINKWYKAYPGISRYFKNVENFVKKNKYITTYFGRVRNLKYCFEKGGDYNFGLRSARNSPIQGTGAEIGKLGLCRFMNRLYEKYKENVMPLSFVHDELNFSVRKDKQLVKEFMIDLYNCLLYQDKVMEIPIVPDFSIGLNWNDLIPVSIGKDNKIYINEEIILIE